MYVKTTSKLINAAVRDPRLVGRCVALYKSTCVCKITHSCVPSVTQSKKQCMANSLADQETADKSITLKD